MLCTHVQCTHGVKAGQVSSLRAAVEIVMNGGQSTGYTSSLCHQLVQGVMAGQMGEGELQEQDARIQSEAVPGISRRFFWIKQSSELIRISQPVTGNLQPEGTN